MIRGNNTNNYAEAGIKVLKEQVFSRIKAYNLIEMVSFCCKCYGDVLPAQAAIFSQQFCGIKLHTVPLKTIKKRESDIFYVNSRSERG